MHLKSFCWKILKPYKGIIALIFLSGALWGGYVSALPYLLKLIIDGLSASKPIEALYWPAIGYVVAYGLAALNFRALDIIKYRILPPIKKSISMEMFNYIKYHSHNYFQNQFAGALSNKVNDMVTSLESLLNSADTFFANFVAFLIAITVMFTVHPVFSIALFIWCLLFFIISMGFSYKINHLANNTFKAFSIYSGTLVDILSNISSVRLFSRMNFEAQTLNQSLSDLVRKDRRMLRYIIVMRFIQDTTLVGLLAIMMVLLVRLYHVGEITIGDFALILTIAMSIFQSMWFLASQIVDIFKHLGRCHQALTLLKTKHEIIDAPGAKELVIQNASIEFRQVTFAYPNCPPLFNHLNVHIHPGAKVGLVGYSGSGKSTFIQLILRIFEVQSGEIYIDGQPIQSVTQASLRHNISMIPQDTSLFHRTLFENIHYGDPNADYEEVIDASKKAHCHEFITQFKDGYDTLVGERGVRLSGGQRQRVAISRAFLENAPILILDEATSALDSVTEKYIQESLHLASQNRTTIVIAHRLSTLLEMDTILVFQDGQIIEQGTHQSLIAQQGHFAKMWAMQSNGFLPLDE